jgi:hypothetical protein
VYRNLEPCIFAVGRAVTLCKLTWLILAHFKTISLHLSGENKENHEMITVLRPPKYEATMINTSQVKGNFDPTCKVQHKPHTYTIHPFPTVTLY